MLKQALKTAQLDKIGRIMDENKLLRHEMEMVKETYERLVKRDELEETTKNFDLFLKIEEFRELENDIQDVVRQDQLDCTNEKLSLIDRR